MQITFPRNIILLAIFVAGCGSSNNNSNTSAADAKANNSFPDLGKKYQYAVQISYEADVYGDKFDTAYTDTCTLERHNKDSVLWVSNDVAYKPDTYPGELPLSTITLNHYIAHVPFALRNNNTVEEKQKINDDNLYLFTGIVRLTLLGDDSIEVTKYYYIDDRANNAKKMDKKRYYGYRIRDRKD
jgi:hypothetical protein